MTSQRQASDPTPAPEAPQMGRVEEFFDWVGYEAWQAHPTQDAFLWMLEEDE